MWLITHALSRLNSPPSTRQSRRKWATRKNWWSTDSAGRGIHPGHCATNVSRLKIHSWTIKQQDKVLHCCRCLSLYRTANQDLDTLSYFYLHSTCVRFVFDPGSLSCVCQHFVFLDSIALHLKCLYSILSQQRTVVKYCEKTRRWPNHWNCCTSWWSHVRTF